MESANPPPATTLDASLAEASQPYIGRWNRLVSTTNWEKGRIICQWREALTDSGAPPAECTDEAWSRLVGGVTGQHAGRLRRVYQRFGAVYEQYAGLYWSHFQAALDWDDAEMWLEGAVQSGWSVSAMRNKRWETLGAVAGTTAEEDDAVACELDEDFEPSQNSAPQAHSISGARDEISGRLTPEGPDFGDEEPPAREGKPEPAEAEERLSASERGHVEAVRPFANLPELPDDLAEAFESFKLAILRHKAEGWERISRADLLASLDALKELALAPAEENAPF